MAMLRQQRKQQRMETGRFTSFSGDFPSSMARQARGGKALEATDFTAIGDRGRRTGGVKAGGQALLINRSIRRVRCCPCPQDVRGERTIPRNTRLCRELHLVARRSQGVVGGRGGGRYASGDHAAVLCRTTTAGDQNEDKRQRGNLRLHSNPSHLIRKRWVSLSGQPFPRSALHL